MPIFKSSKFVSYPIIMKQDGTIARVILILDRQTEVQILFPGSFKDVIHSTAL